MAELKTKEAELTTAELASYGVAQKQPDGAEGNAERNTGKVEKKVGQIEKVLEK